MKVTIHNSAFNSFVTHPADISRWDPDPAVAGCQLDRIVSADCHEISTFEASLKGRGFAAYKVEGGQLSAKSLGDSWMGRGFELTAFLHQ